MNNAFIASIVVCIVWAAPSAFAQSGSTGGSIGKTEKSISGEQAGEESNARPRRHRLRRSESGEEAEHGSSCQAKIVGQWRWHYGTTISIRPGGGLSESNGTVGHWTCSGNSITMKWKEFGGITDWLTLSPDGRRMSGTNNLGAHAGATR